MWVFLYPTRSPATSSVNFASFQKKVSKFSVCASLGVLGKRVSRVENGRLSCVAFVSFCEIQSNHALPRGGGICGNALWALPYDFQVLTDARNPWFVMSIEDRKSYFSAIFPSFLKGIFEKREVLFWFFVWKNASKLRGVENAHTWPHMVRLTQRSTSKIFASFSSVRCTKLLTSAKFSVEAAQHSRLSQCSVWQRKKFACNADSAEIVQIFRAKVRELVANFLRLWIYGYRPYMSLLIYCIFCLFFRALNHLWWGSHVFYVFVWKKKRKLTDFDTKINKL